MPQLRIGEGRMPPGMRLIAEPFDAVLLEYPHPALDAARVIAEDLGDLIATPTRSHQQQAVQPVQVA